MGELLFGALEKIRTPDLLVRSQTLYPAELRALVVLKLQRTHNTMKTGICQGKTLIRSSNSSTAVSANAWSLIL